MYTKIPFYGSTDSEEFLDWEEQIEYELELQDFSDRMLYLSLKIMLVIGGSNIYTSALSSVEKI